MNKVSEKLPSLEYIISFFPLYTDCSCLILFHYSFTLFLLKDLLGFKATITTHYLLLAIG